MRVAAALAKYLKENQTHNGCGKDCVYYQLSDNIGLKTYYDYQTAINTYLVQKEMHSKGVAADCWGFSSKEGRHAYFTEHAVIIDHLKDAWHATGFIKRIVENSEAGYMYQGCPDETIQWYAIEEFASLAIAQINEMLRPLGYRAGDTHWGNYGFINGKPVMVDFGNCFPNKAIVSPTDYLDKRFLGRHEKIHAA